jgi:lantibiotic biosynthesis protein
MYIRAAPDRLARFRNASSGPDAAGSAKGCTTFSGLQYLSVGYTVPVDTASRNGTATTIQAALHVAQKLKAPGDAESAAAAAATQSEFPQFSYWVPSAIAQGNAGLCVLWAYLDECLPGEGWDIVGKLHLEMAVRAAEVAPPAGGGLFSGLSGLAFAAIQLSRGGTRYRGLLRSLDDAITAEAMTLANRVRDASGVSTGDFDVISGLSGIGACLLCRQGEQSVQVALANITDALVSLVLRDPSRPAWHTPAVMLYDEVARSTYPNGNLNCGMAHGIPGVLAYLALVHGQKDCLVSRERLEEAIVTAATWIVQNRADDEWGVNWPTAVALTENGQAASPAMPSRSAWCYGAPGVARPLWMAGKALGRADYCDLAVLAMEAVFRRPLSARMIDSPSFCHGVAGLLAVTLRFARESGSAVFAAEAEKLTTQLLESFHEDHLLGFRNIEYRNNQTDQPGLLDGAGGIALVLLAAGTRVDPKWDRLFLLS